MLTSSKNSVQFINHDELTGKPTSETSVIAIFAVFRLELK